MRQHGGYHLSIATLTSASIADQTLPSSHSTFFPPFLLSCLHSFCAAHTHATPWSHTTYMSKKINPVFSLLSLDIWLFISDSYTLRSSQLPCLPCLASLLLLLSTLLISLKVRIKHRTIWTHSCFLLSSVGSFLLSLSCAFLSSWTSTIRYWEVLYIFFSFSFSFFFLHR